MNRNCEIRKYYIHLVTSCKSSRLRRRDIIHILFSADHPQMTCRTFINVHLPLERRIYFPFKEYVRKDNDISLLALWNLHENVDWKYKNEYCCLFITFQPSENMKFHFWLCQKQGVRIWVSSGCEVKTRMFVHGIFFEQDRQKQTRNQAIKVNSNFVNIYERYVNLQSCFDFTA